MRKLTSFLFHPVGSHRRIRAPNPEMIVVCYPAAPSMPRTPTRDEFHAAGVERVGQWQENSFNSLFTTKSDECRKQITKKNPNSPYSLGLYLELRSQHNLVRWSSKD